LEKFGFLLFTLCISLLLATTSLAQSGKIHFDFETGDLQGWKVISGSFGSLITERSECRNRPGEKLNKQGRYFLSTIEKPDGSYDDSFTGRLISPVFKLKGPKITLLVGGGGHPNTYVALCTMDAKEVLLARGSFDEHFNEITWDAKDYVGKNVFLMVVDEVNGSWGHVTLDDIQADGDIVQVSTDKIVRAIAGRAKRGQIDRKAFIIERKKLRDQLNSPKVLFTRGSSKIYSGKSLEAIDMPVGGIGAGCIQVNGYGEMALWQIFNNYLSTKVPESLLAVRVKSGDTTVIRALQTTDVGNLKGMNSVKLKAEYPFAWYDFKDKSIPVSVKMEIYSPFIPMNSKDSAIPCAIFRVTVTNNTLHTVEASVLQSQQNAVGFDGLHMIEGRSHAGYGGNINQLTHSKNETILSMSSKTGPIAGNMALACLSGNATGCASYRNMDSLISDFASNGRISGPGSSSASPAGRTVSGALASTVSLEPGASKTVTFALTWYFPVVDYGSRGWGGASNMYFNWWNDASDVARYVSTNHTRLYDQTRLYHDTFYQSNMPQYLLDRVTSQVAILRSKTVFWAANGFIGAFEGCGSGGGCCAGNCVHVWQYAQAHARLFPEIGRKFREQEFALQTPDGGIPHRELENFTPAADGHLGAILGSYREYLTSADGKWLQKNWPHIKSAMGYAINTWDKDEDGVLSGTQWNTLDSNLGGSTTWIGSLYLASLAACEKMALLQNDPDSAKRFEKIRTSGSVKQDSTLFNGEYFTQIPDPQPYNDYITGCAIDQLLGQWWATQLNLGALYPEDHIRTALASLFKSNFKSPIKGNQQSPRQFVDDEDSAMQMITWPKGGRPDGAHTTVYSDEVMSGFEYSAAGAMIQSGLLQEGFKMVKAISDRYDGVLRTNLTGGDWASWGYSGNPFGDDECGKFYARAMSSWGLLLSCQGFIYNGPAGLIGFRPTWSPENHASFFTAAEGWGLFKQTRKPTIQTGILDLRYGTLTLNKFTLSVPKTWTNTTAKADINGKPVTCTTQQSGTDTTIVFQNPQALKSGDILKITLKQGK